MNARLSALSLTYYAYCMGSGNYTVTLHFAEIMFTDDNTFTSLGRRVFDIYIQVNYCVVLIIFSSHLKSRDEEYKSKLAIRQGERVDKDFNIEKEGGGVGKPLVKNFTAVVKSTLEIRLYWAGKGTTGIPSRGVYGPLISAISVTSGKLKILQKARTKNLYYFIFN